MPSPAAMMMRERSAESEPVKTAATISPTETEIATVAYQLWLDNGCPVGSDQEDWFLARAMVKNALVAKCKDRWEHSSIPRSDTPPEFEILAAVRWEGHWVVWESEWAGARWIWDLGHSSH